MSDFLEKNQTAITAGVGGTVATVMGGLNLLNTPNIQGAGQGLKTAYAESSQVPLQGGLSMGESANILDARIMADEKRRSDFANSLNLNISPAVLETLITANKQQNEKLTQQSAQPLTSAQIETSLAISKENAKRMQVANETSNTITKLNLAASTFERKMRDEQLRAFNNTMEAVSAMLFAGFKTDALREAAKAAETPLQSFISQNLMPPAPESPLPSPFKQPIQTNDNAMGGEIV